MNMIREAVAPPQYVRYAHQLGRGMLTFEQIDELVKAINPAYVETKQRLTYLAQHQARAEMNRIFGYGNWDVHAGAPVLMYEYETQGTGQNAQKTYWRVGYRITVTVAIRDLWGMPVAEFTGVHAEQNAPQPDRGEAHALALTSVDSYALRRALINLGDRFGLGLYDGGSTQPHGVYTIQQQSGQLYTWQPAEQPQQPALQPAQQQVQPQQQAPQPQQQAQQQAQQAPAPQPQQQGYQQSPEMREFQQVAAQQQASREASRQNTPSPEMQQRLQQGLKQDNPGGQA